MRSSTRTVCVGKSAPTQAKWCSRVSWCWPSARCRTRTSPPSREWSRSAARSTTPRTGHIRASISPVNEWASSARDRQEFKRFRASPSRQVSCMCSSAVPTTAFPREMFRSMTTCAGRTRPAIRNVAGCRWPAGVVHRTNRIHCLRSTCPSRNVEKPTKSVGSSAVCCSARPLPTRCSTQNPTTPPGSSGRRRSARSSTIRRSPTG